VGYEFSGCRLDVGAANSILERATRQQVVTQFVAKRYTEEDIVWFNGPPGPALRAVRAEIAKLVQ
jgi:hypothetical protein